ncbi:MotA/TolQ/ExbB proton channel family protein, partial [Herbaspirillum sp. HC18]
NALIGAVLFIGIVLAFRQVIRLYPEVSWVNNFRIADPGLAPARHPKLLAPMAAILGGERSGRMTITQTTMRHLLDSIATRLDEARDISRYMTGLLVFLGLLGTVVGVMITFAAIAASGDVNVNAIAPGIAAALVATVAGLGVAIPALFAYNYLTIRIKDASSEMQVFVDEFITRIAESYEIPDEPLKQAAE